MYLKALYELWSLSAYTSKYTLVIFGTVLE